MRDMEQTGYLPALTPDELGELHRALDLRMNALAKAKVMADDDETKAECDRLGLVCQSLDTAVMELWMRLRELRPPS